MYINPFETKGLNFKMIMNWIPVVRLDVIDVKNGGSGSESINNGSGKHTMQLSEQVQRSGNGF
jgi:hypothetical protein